VQLEQEEQDLQIVFQVVQLLMQVAEVEEQFLMVLVQQEQEE
jgi:hypothetical protein